jgi:hypothetical protein
VFAEFGVDEDEGEKGAEVFSGWIEEGRTLGREKGDKDEEHTLVSVLLRLVIVEGLTVADTFRSVVLERVCVDSLGMEDEFCRSQVSTLLLLLNHELRCLHDVPNFLNELLGLTRELRLVDRGIVEDVVEAQIRVEQEDHDDIWKMSSQAKHRAVKGGTSREAA